MANLSLKLLVLYAILWNFDSIQGAALIDSSPQEQLASGTASFRVENPMNSNLSKEKIEIHSKFKGKHAALLDINESDLSDAEKEAKKKHELRKLKHYVPQLMGNFANVPEHENMAMSYVQLMQELDQNRRARRFAEAETEDVEENGENSQPEVEAAQPEENEENSQPEAEAIQPEENEEIIRSGSDLDSENVEEETAAETQMEIAAEDTEAINSNDNENVNSDQVDEPNSENDGEEKLTEPDENSNTYNAGTLNPQNGEEEGPTEAVKETEPENVEENENEGQTNPAEQFNDVGEQDAAISGPEVNDDITGRDDPDGFETESPNEIPLKQHVLTSILEAEVLTDSFDCSGNRGPLTQMATDSKFFVDSLRLHTFLEAREVCSKNNLVIAEVQELGDHWAIDEFMSLRNYHETKGSSSGSRFFIGLNDIKREGVFKHANGKNVTYQNFLPSQPDDFNQTEDCVTITKERRNGPSGAADYDCNSTAHVFCMFRVDGQCYNESKETIENRKLIAERELHLLVNASERAYFVSTYQSTWKEAMKQCNAKEMKLFNMDEVINRGFFRSMIHWEKKFFRIPMPTVQYWTSGKFKKSHMSAPIIWHTKPELDESEERGIEKHNGTFSFSGLYQWSTKKIVDPGGPHGWRRDLCVSFGFDRSPEETPYLRNTNCDLPTYFICYVEYPDIEKNSGEETTMEEGVITVNSEDVHDPPE